MKQLSLVAGIALALTLTACGSSSSGTGGNAAGVIGGTPVIPSNTSSTGTSTDTGTATGTGTSTGTTTGTSTGTTTGTGTTTTNTLGVSGNIIAIDANKIAGANQATGTSTNINQIVVGGQTIEFFPANFTETAINQIDVKTGVGRLGIKNEQSNYGYFQESVGSTPYLFSQGNVSASTPVANVVEYEGQAIHFDQGSQDKLKNPTGLTLANSKFSADFTKKKLLGSIVDKTDETKVLVELEANIKDNGFFGTTTTGMTTNGYFYGDNATELGGTYKNSDGEISGAYGATKK